MRRSRLLLWIAAGSLTVGVLVGGSLASRAQLGGDDDCRLACRADKSRCVEECSGSGNPLECEAACHDRLEDCLMRCD